MVSNPEQFEVMVMPNLYGNIIANIGTGLVGGPGTTAGANIGTRCAVFEQVCWGFVVGLLQGGMVNLFRDSAVAMKISICPNFLIILMFKKKI